MISLIKNIIVVGVMLAAVALLCAAVQWLHDGSPVERQEYIKVPSNSRPILAPCDVDK